MLSMDPHQGTTNPRVAGQFIKAGGTRVVVRVGS
jgi:hypothetical protein